MTGLKRTDVCKVIVGESVLMHTKHFPYTHKCGPDEFACSEAMCSSGEQRGEGVNLIVFFRRSAHIAYEFGVYLRRPTTLKPAIDIRFIVGKSQLQGFQLYLAHNFIRWPFDKVHRPFRSKEHL